jgi:hypothetical protein
MTIPIWKVLDKMEQEIKNAKAASSESKIRERIQALKTLCELVLDEQEQLHAARKIDAAIQQTQPHVPRAKPLELGEDDANGESLFDF